MFTFSPHLSPLQISTGLAWGIYLQSYSWAKGRHRGEGDANRKLSPISNMLAALEVGSGSYVWAG